MCVCACARPCTYACVLMCVAALCSLNSSFIFSCWFSAILQSSLISAEFSCHTHTQKGPAERNDVSKQGGQFSWSVLCAVIFAFIKEESPVTPFQSHSLHTSTSYFVFARKLNSTQQFCDVKSQISQSCPLVPPPTITCSHKPNNTRINI